MNGSVIHHNDGAAPQLRNENLLDVEQEHIGIDAAHDAQSGNQPIDTHAPNQRDVLTTITCSLAVIQAFANGGTTI